MLNRGQFATLFPFHFVLDGNMRVVDCGSVLLRICPELIVGSNIADHFTLFRLGDAPAKLLSREWVLQQQATLFIFKSRSSELILRLQLVILDDPERFLFLGSPWVRNATELKSLQLVLRDFALHDSTGDLLQLVESTNTSLRDATQLATRLEVRNAELKQLIDSANAPILIIDSAGKVADWNKTTERLTGFRINEVIGKQFIDTFVVTESQDDVRRLLLDTFAGRSGGNMEFLMHTRDQRKLLAIFSASPKLSIDGSVAGTILVGQDITELGEYRTQLEKRVADRTEQLALANEELSRVMRSKDDFVSAMSHELRTPLNAILGLSESLAEGVYGNLNEKQVKSITTIAESGHHLLSLINDLLDIAKIGAGKMELEWLATNVDDACQASLRFVAELAAKRKLTLQLEIDAEAHTITVDQRRLKQMLVNLLANAVKFTPEGGTVTLSTKADMSSDVVAFSVRDTGIGIAPEDLHRLFSPFTQLDSKLSRQYAGTGLGLTLVLKLAELHGGSVLVESELGSGSCFTIKLPWKNYSSSNSDGDARGEGSPVEASAAAGELANSPLILVADDNEINMMTVGDYLVAHGFRLSQAGNGLDAINLVREQSPDLVLMDIQMPIMDGLQAIKHLRAESKYDDVPIIALTSRAMVGDRERCLEAGANEYLSKPVNLKQLLSVIHSQLDARRSK